MPAEEEPHPKARSAEVILNVLSQQERRLSKRMDELQQLIDAPRSVKGKGKLRHSSSQVSMRMQVRHSYARTQ